jgi:tetratricopeptide (TPR) repeat protein
MTVRCRLLPALCTVLLAACGSVPDQPALIEDYRHYMRSAGEHYERGRLPLAMDYYQRALVEAELVDNHVRMTDSLYHIGLVALQVGDTEQASAALEIARTLNAAADDTDLELLEAQVAYQTGRHQQAIAIYTRLLSGRLSDTGAVSALNGRALAYLASDQPDRARADAEQALRRIDGKDQPALQSATLLNLAQIHARAGELGRAEQLARQSLAIDRQRLAPPAIAADLYVLAGVLHAQGDTVQARELFRRAERIFTQTGQAWQAEAARIRRQNISREAAR